MWESDVRCVAFQDGRVRCLSAVDGRQLWASEDHGSPVFATPTVVETSQPSSLAVLSVATEGKALLLTDLETGSARLRLVGLPGSEQVFSTPVVCGGGGMVVLARRDDRVYGCRLVEGENSEQRQN